MRYHSLDIWRGLACLWVVFFHARAHVEDYLLYENWVTWFFSYGHYGVQIFFVISGYCIMASVVGLLDQPDKIKQYAFRRLIRIYPTYWASIIFTLLLLSLVSVVHSKILIPRGWIYWFSQATLTQKILNQATLVGPYWSLTYEIQFYLIMGLCLAPTVKRWWPHILAFAAMTWVYLDVEQGTLRGFFLDYWLQFYVGILVYETLASKTKRPKNLLMAVLVLLTGYGMLINDSELLICLAFALVLLILYRTDLILNRLKLLKPFSLLGLISYSLYLTHQPLLHRMSLLFRTTLDSQPKLYAFMIVSTTLCILTAVIFFQIFEKTSLAILTTVKSKQYHQLQNWWSFAASSFRQTINF